MAERVLVTRPQPGAGRSAARLRAAGYEPVVIPLSEIVPLSPQLPEGEFAAIAASSANAVRHAPAGLVARIASKPLFVVGDKTAAVAAEAGFTNVRSSAGSAADLAHDIVAACASGLRIAYLCGRVRRDALEARLAGAGLQVMVIETYDTRARAPSPGELAVLDRGPIAAAVVYSANVAEALAGLAEPRSGTIFARTAFIAISERVAEKLTAVARARMSVAAAPDEDAMFDLLSRMRHDAARIPDKHD